MSLASERAEDHRLHVLFVIDSLGAGGAERSLAELLPWFREAGINASIVCLLRRDEGPQRDVLEAGFHVEFLSTTGRAGRVRQLRRLMRALHPDLVHTTLFESDVAGRLAAAGLGIPVLTSLVGEPYHPSRLRDANVRPWRLSGARALDGWTARHLTAHFHAVTAAAAGHAVRSLGIHEAGITVIPRGRDRSRVGARSEGRSAAARSRLGLGADDLVVLNVGRQEFQKGQVHLIEALAMLPASSATPIVLLVGREGRASAELARRSREAGLGDRVRVLGERDDVPELLAAADVFAFPSLYEGIGGAVIEAMALGLPIVASDLPGLREVVEPGENALLVPPGDSGALAGAVGRLLNDAGMRASFGTRGREIFDRRFTLERIAPRMVDLYRSLARPVRGPSEVRA